MERFEDVEHRQSRTQELDEDIHRAFRPLEGDVETDSPAEEDLVETKKQMQHEASYGTRLQGDIGEGVATRVASEKLGLTPDPRFDQPGHGLDGVFKDDETRFVFVEAKCTGKGPASLRGDQMRSSWVSRTLEKMRDSGGEQYSLGNAEIAREVLDTGLDRIRYLVVDTDPKSLEVTAYEAQVDGTWRKIGSWDAYEFEQLHV